MFTAPRHIGWGAKINIAGLASIFIILTYLTTQYCSQCNPIHQSIYGRPLGIPLSVYGVVYVAILLLLMKNNRTYYKYGLHIALIISLFLVAIQAVVLKQYCVYCLTCEGIFYILWLINNRKPQSIYLAISVLLVTVSVVTLGCLMEAVANDSTNYLNQETRQYVVTDHNGKMVLLDTTGREAVVTSTTCKYCLKYLNGLTPEEKTQIIIIAVNVLKPIPEVKDYYVELGIKPENIYYDTNNTVNAEYLPYIIKGGL